VRIKDVDREIPYLARFLLEWEAPDLRDGSDLDDLGGHGYWDPRVVQSQYQPVETPTIVRLIDMFLHNYASQHPTYVWWEGDAKALSRALREFDPTFYRGPFVKSRRLSLVLGRLRREGYALFQYTRGKTQERLWRMSLRGFNRPPDVYMLQRDHINDNGVRSEWYSRYNMGRVRKELSFNWEYNTEAPWRERVYYSRIDQPDVITPEQAVVDHMVERERENDLYDELTEEDLNGRDNF